MYTISVITFAVDRPALLAKCISSVRTQTGNPPTAHHVFSEIVERLWNAPELREHRQHVTWHNVASISESSPPSPRMAKLRNDAVTQIHDPFCCFLDDDNEFLPEHLASLHNLLITEHLDAVHSWRTIATVDGMLFGGNYYPWHKDPQRAQEMYACCVKHGIIVPGDSVMKDGMYGPQVPEDVSTVDMNEWLFRTEVLRDVGFDLKFSDDDIDNGVGEDDKLFRRVCDHGVRFACTKRATVLYRLGGVSNR